MAIRPEILAAMERAKERKEEQLKRVVALVASKFNGLRSLVVGALGGVDTQALQRQVSSLINDLRRASGVFQREVTADVLNAFDEAKELGQEVIDQPLIAAAVRVAAPDVTLPLMQVLSDFTADRITNLSAAVISEISLELRLGALGAKDVHDVIDAVTAKLRTARAGDAGFGSLAARGEAIVRTELGRIHSLAGQRRMEQAAETMPDLMKEWIHSGNPRFPRDGHVAYSGTRVPVHERFLVAPVIGGTREALLCPRDPAGSARSVVRCRCDALPWRPSWEQ